MKKIIIALTITLISALTVQVYAQAVEVEQTEVVAEESYSDPGTYSSSTSESAAVGNYSLKIGPIGNIYIVDSTTELDPGIGGFIAFDYRFHSHFSAEVGLLATLQDGTGINAGDNNIILLGTPTFDIKYYFLGESRWDPYASLGFGLYTLTEGSIDNGTKAFGVGANLGLGIDYYFTSRFSAGLAATFRAIAFVESIGGSHNGSSLFPFSMSGNFGYHF